jgi:hypothetical protein
MSTRLFAAAVLAVAALFPLELPLRTSAARSGSRRAGTA